MTIRQIVKKEMELRYLGRRIADYRGNGYIVKAVEVCDDIDEGITVTFWSHTLEWRRLPFFKEDGKTVNRDREPKDLQSFTVYASDDLPVCV